MRKFLLIFLLCISQQIFSQELYVYTEPASNMAAKSIGLRLNNYLMDEVNTSKINYHLVPEIMLGISKKIMVHTDIFLSNRDKNFVAEGGSIYAKYRFLSNDEVQKHFRMAAFARLSFNNSDLHQEEININGHNSGWETGIVTTQLLHKVALSATASFVNATANDLHKFPTDANKVINYSFSFGKLMLPKEYKSYNQVNMNFMIESLNQINTISGKYYFDIAPSLQFIFNSQSRIDVGYRKQLAATLQRTAPNGFLIRFEHNLFNAW